MDGPIDDVAFLARSPNRVRALEALSERPLTRSELMSEVDVSKSTASRVLADLLRRGWITESNGEHQTTVVGELVAADFSRLETTMAAAARLGPVAKWLPEDLGFDLRRLADAFVLDPDRYDPVAQIERWMEITRKADQVWLVTSTISRSLAELFRDEVADGMEYRGVLSTGVVEKCRERRAIRRPTLALLEAGSELYEFSGDMPHVLGCFDELAVFVGLDDAGATRLAFESSDDEVRTWALQEFDRYREAATELTPDDVKA